MSCKWFCLSLYLLNGLVTGAPTDIKSTDKLLERSLMALKNHGNDVTNKPRQENVQNLKESVMVDHEEGPSLLKVPQTEDLEEMERAAQKLTKYILDTGDQAGVVEFLQFMLRAGKLTPKQVVIYVKKVMENLREEEGLPVQSKVDPLREARIRQQEINMEVKEQENHDQRLLKLKQQKEDLTKERDNLIKSKEEIEGKLAEVEKVSKQEEEKFDKEETIKGIIKDIKDGEKDNETILEINDFLEQQKKEGKVSESLYFHVKEALIETTVENLTKISSN